MFSTMSTADLIARMENASDDQNIDDETVELSKRVGDKWYWLCVENADCSIVINSGIESEV